MLSNSPAVCHRAFFSTEAPWTAPFLFFIMMTVSLGVMNLILAGIVERAAEARANDQDVAEGTGEISRNKLVVYSMGLYGNPKKVEGHFSDFYGFIYGVMEFLRKYMGKTYDLQHGFIWKI
jgi:hypothetical protein